MLDSGRAADLRHKRRMGEWRPSGGSSLPAGGTADPRHAGGTLNYVRRILDEENKCQWGSALRTLHQDFDEAGRTRPCTSYQAPLHVLPPQTCSHCRRERRLLVCWCCAMHGYLCLCSVGPSSRCAAANVAPAWRVNRDGLSVAGAVSAASTAATRSGWCQKWNPLYSAPLTSLHVPSAMA